MKVDDPDPSLSAETFTKTRALLSALLEVTERVNRGEFNGVMLTDSFDDAEAGRNSPEKSSPDESQVCIMWYLAAYSWYGF